FGKSRSDMTKAKTMRALKDFLRPEFLARIDEIVAFNPLTEENLRDIAALMIGEYVKPMEQKGITLTWDEAALAVICDKANGGQFGARDIRRVIRKEVEDKIAEVIINSGELSKVHVTAKDGEIVVEC
ncbi:MAG: ATP-dependent Clp protease ATP-binding subunit, partial [Oscillospiraceae bacterium]|nr:ATP-dependent Clp protease ATP-binding subunit [Oscillospiraceae bacterium]